MNEVAQDYSPFVGAEPFIMNNAFDMSPQPTARGDSRTIPRHIGLEGVYMTGLLKVT